MFGKIIRTIIVLLIGIIIGVSGVFAGGYILVANTKIGTITDKIGSGEDEIVSDELKDLTIIEAFQLISNDLSVGTVEYYVPAVSTYLDNLFASEPLSTLVEIDREKLKEIGFNNIGSVTDCVKIVADLEDVFSLVGVDFNSIGMGFIEELSFYSSREYQVADLSLFLTNDAGFVVATDTSKKGEYFVKNGNTYTKTNPVGGDTYYIFNQDFIMPEYCVYKEAPDSLDYLPVYVKDGNTYTYNVNADGKTIYKVLPALNEVVISKLPTVLSQRFKDLDSADVMIVLDSLGLKLEGVFEKFFYRPLTQDVLTAGGYANIYDEGGNQIIYTVEPVTNRLLTADMTYIFKAYSTADTDRVQIRDAVALGDLSNAMNDMSIGVLIDGYAYGSDYELMRSVLSPETTLNELISGTGIDTDNLTLGDVLGDTAFDGNVILQAIGKTCKINEIGTRVNQLQITDIIDNYATDDGFSLIRKIIPADTPITEIANIDFENITDKITIKDAGIDGLPEFVYKALGYTNKVGDEYLNGLGESHYDITVSELATITLDDVQGLTLTDVGISFEGNDMLTRLIPADTPIKDIQTVVQNNIDNIPLHDIFQGSSGNNIIDSLISHEVATNPVTVGNIGERINQMDLKDLVENDIMAKVDVTSATFSYTHALYTYNETTKTYNIVTSATFSTSTAKYNYTGLDYQNTDYYEVSGGIWFLILAEVPTTASNPLLADKTKYNYGAYDTVKYTGTTVGDLSDLGETESIYVADYKLKLLNDLGLIKNLNVNLYEWSINSLISTVSV